MNDADQNASAPLPRACFDAAIFPAAERFDIWRANIAPFAKAYLAPGVTPEQFSFRSEFVQLGQTHLGCTWQRGIGVYRTNGAREVPEAPDVFFLQTYLKGGFSGYHGSYSMTVASGDIVLLDSIQPMHTWVGGEEELLSLAIPRQMLTAQLDGRFAPVHHIIPAHSTSAVLLRQALVTLWGRLPQMNAAEAGQAEAVLVGAVAGLLRGGSEPQQATGPAQLTVIRGYIDEHLHDTGLDADYLCRHFHCSRATLYRLFAPLDGVAGYIRKARLERCHADLLAARPGDTTARIALRWGFGSEHHFSRLYRTTFGTPPGETLSQRREKKD